MKKKTTRKEAERFLIKNGFREDDVKEAGDEAVLFLYNSAKEVKRK